MTTMLHKYLAMEGLMLFLDSQGDERGADGLRDLMDSLWYDLSDDDRKVLDERSVGEIETLEGIRVPVGTTLFEQVRPIEKHEIGADPIRNWRSAA